ncbi:Scarecrow-like protein 14 [Linum perenne]
MDSNFMGSSASTNGFTYNDQTLFPNLSHYTDSAANGYRFNSSSSTMDLSGNFMDNSLGLTDLDASTITSPEGDSPTDDNDFGDTVLKYINQMLMEEDMEQKPCMFHDPLAVQAAEKSLYDVIGEKYPPSPAYSSSFGDQFLVDSPGNESSYSVGSDFGGSSSSTGNSASSIDVHWSSELGDSKTQFMQMPLPTDFVFQSPSLSRKQNERASNSNGKGNGNDVVSPYVGNFVVPNFFSGSELEMQFKRGVEEANKFLPKVTTLVIDLENKNFTPKLEEKPPVLAVKAEREEDNYLPNFKVKRNHDREDDDFKEERSSKQSAVYLDEFELSEMFDKLLICNNAKDENPSCILNHEDQENVAKCSQQNGNANGSKSNGNKSRVKRQGSKKDGVVDLRTLLVTCAQAVSSDDRRTANELLRQIKQHSSPFGDGSQRLAHCFANALEARLAGNGTQIYTALSADKTSASDMLKAYQAYISACPFKKVAIIFANHSIMHAAADANASTIHIIDFGILYGFQWPALIHRLSKRPGGPPKLRITGVELPQSGFRPGERVQATGRRLANYCERHNVPFEYNAIAKKWENIQLDELKINKGEFLAVNCLFRCKNLLDETVMVNSPRDAVLRLIKMTNPSIFIHAIVNGSYNAPFFMTRFREALFHFSSLFDMLDANMAREDQMRMKFEKEFYGREAINVMACEGSERVERPETYKQWQVRNTRAGMKQLPLDPLMVKRLKCKVRGKYHEDFVVNEDGEWLLQGWKGRIIYASSAWVPAS